MVEDPDSYGYFRPEGDGLLVGLFEPEAAAWSLDGVPSGSSFLELAPDYDRLAPFVERAMARVPSLADTGIRTFFCGPESFTSDVHPLLGPAPELDNYFVAAGLNSLGILLGGGVGTVLAHWIVDGEPPVDVTGYAIDRTAAHESTRAFRQRANSRAARCPLRRCRLPLMAAEDGPEHATDRPARSVRGGRGPLQHVGGMGVRRVVRG